ncbi:hypothetical protein N7449_007538 [Penicillium cf. viridicatum]|uniref:Uncharacterized protein n=1 Tax=Penicillium cf. viridicatum TaxID=2972119 RepID=A0A9W9JIQ5_9EURO|nr:hypothetical protein N7449_007538 [Penicillium cf. viridicatum]
MSSRSHHKAEMISPSGIVLHYLKTTLESGIPDSRRKIATDKQGKDRLCDVAVKFAEERGVSAAACGLSGPRVWPGGNATRKVNTKKSRLVWIIMPRNVVGQIPPQTTSNRYLRKANLQGLLERLFPGQTDFGIQLREDQWWFTAPKIVDTDN